MALSKTARAALSNARQKMTKQTKDRLLGGAIGAVAGMAYEDKFPQIGGFDSRLAVSLAGLMAYKPSGKRGALIQGALVGIGVPAAIEWAADEVVPAVQRALPNTGRDSLPPTPDAIQNQPTTRQ